MSSHSASTTSNTNIGSYASQVTDADQLMGPPNRPASCSGRITTSKTDAITPNTRAEKEVIRESTAVTCVRLARAKLAMPAAM